MENKDPTMDQMWDLLTNISNNIKTNRGSDQHPRAINIPAAKASFHYLCLHLHSLWLVTVPSPRPAPPRASSSSRPPYPSVITTDWWTPTGACPSGSRAQTHSALSSLPVPTPNQTPVSPTTSQSSVSVTVHLCVCVRVFALPSRRCSRKCLSARRVTWSRFSVWSPAEGPQRRQQPSNYYKLYIYIFLK